MVAGFHGYHADLVSLERTAGISNQAVSLRSIEDVTDTVLFSHRPLKVELEDINQVNLPKIFRESLKDNIGFFGLLIGHKKISSASDNASISHQIKEMNIGLDSLIVDMDSSL